MDPRRNADFRSYGEAVVRERLRKMLSHAEAVRVGEDIEALHDMRVASRRTRAALTVFESAFVDPDFPAFEREVKSVTRALGLARDLDVMIETLAKLEGGLPPATRRGFERLLDDKRRDRTAAQAGVIRALSRAEKRDLATWFDQIAARSRGEDVPRQRSRRGRAATPAATPPDPEPSGDLNAPAGSGDDS